MNLNLGCGKTRFAGYMNVDMIKNKNVDFVANLNKKLPFKNKSIKLIKCYNVLEHLKNFDIFFSELYRITTNDCYIEIITDNANYWGYALENECHSNNYKGGLEFKDDNHYCLFTKEHLERFASDYGFKSNVTYECKSKYGLNFLFSLIGLKRMGYVRLRLILTK